VPLQVHARYSRIEILAAFGLGGGGKIAAWQSGVYEAKEAKARVGILERIKVLRAVAAEIGATPNQVALAWLLGGEVPVIPQPSAAVMNGSGMASNGSTVTGRSVPAFVNVTVTGSPGCPTATSPNVAVDGSSTTASVCTSAKRRDAGTAPFTGDVTYALRL
jgi:hypothetical protein